MIRNKTSILAKRLASKIERELGIACDASTFRRTYAGYWQKSQGAFLWTIQQKYTPFYMGSCDTTSDCVKKKYRLEIVEGGHGEICAVLNENEEK